VSAKNCLVSIDKIFQKLEKQVSSHFQKCYNSLIRDWKYNETIPLVVDKLCQDKCHV